MVVIGWIVSTLALIEAGWFAFDGAHALITGDYVTPKRGPYAGQLGPWSKLVSSVGIEPRSTLMKMVHLSLGIIWIFAIVSYVMQFPWGWTAMFICAIAGLWYLPFGTLLSIVQIALLLLPAILSQIY